MEKLIKVINKKIRKINLIGLHLLLLVPKKILHAGRNGLVKSFHAKHKTESVGNNQTINFLVHYL